MEEFSKEELDQLFSVFRDQSLQILDDMGQDVLVLEARGIEDEALACLRRGAHTIKGDAACVGLEGVTEVAHRIEDIFGWVVEGKLEMEADLVDWILSNLDAIRAAISGEEIEDISADELARLAERCNVAVESGRAGSVRASEGPQLQREEAVCEGRQNQGVKGFVRVEPGRIDSLLNLAGEMVIARSLMNQIGPELEAVLPRHELVSRLNVASMQMGKLISELQKSVLKMRMVQIGAVFKRFSRPMRELAAERGKQVELVTQGDETELDRTLVDSLYEPLLHLLRNSVDHGLETALERAAAGKPPSGRIRLSAYHEGNQVVVEVSDDGRGIDVKALKAKAMEGGVLRPQDAEAMDEEQSLELVFLQGVSTAREVTWVSGRGIGMAAVRAAIEQMRGSISVRSSVTEGTTFTIRMPLTLAIIRGLLFWSTGQLFALPLLSVSEIVEVRAEEIICIDEFESFRLRGSFVSLIRPGMVLGFERRKGGSGAQLRVETNRVFIIILNTGSKKYGLVADRLIGEQELVIKPLEDRWLQNDVLAGASILGDGRVVLIMDAGVMIRKAVKYERKRGELRGVYGF